MESAQADLKTDLFCGFRNLIIKNQEPKVTSDLMDVNPLGTGSSGRNGRRVKACLVTCAPVFNGFESDRFCAADPSAGFSAQLFAHVSLVQVHTFRSKGFSLHPTRTESHCFLEKWHSLVGAVHVVHGESSASLPMGWQRGSERVQDFSWVGLFKTVQQAVECWDEIADYVVHQIARHIGVVDVERFVARIEHGQPQVFVDEIVGVVRGFDDGPGRTCCRFDSAIVLQGFLQQFPCEFELKRELADDPILYELI